jgi:hypothetical protein
MQAFQKAAEGIRTHDLLHGKQNVGDGRVPQRACKRWFLARARAEAGFLGFRGDLRQFED